VNAPAEYRREVLRQAGVALAGREVTLWEVTPGTGVAPLASNVPTLPSDATRSDLDATLRQWGAPIAAGSRWIGCRLDDARRWCVAPVRSRPPDPPPGGIERRSRERLILELAGLCLGTLDAWAGPKERLSPAAAAWEHARQPSVIAHEVGNQLTVAGGNLAFAIAAVTAASFLGPEFRTPLLEDLKNSAKGIERATDYLRAILHHPGPEPGKVSRFDLGVVVRSCVTLERPLAHKRGVALSWEAATEPAYLSGDPNALYQVVTNLIRNAVDASEERNGTVLVTLRRVADSLHLAVQDRGVGIAPEHRDRILEAGFTTKLPGFGSGMGLAVVREITEHIFGGTIQVESKLGEGSTFTLVLPVPPQRAGN
jgi:signal transduction histidine kinase